ncbi:thiol:disulfide interchange protein [Acuticoccus sediminis]|uniref:Thiol:disulfide interchange protein n=1 Tax=Acuticoccus sediminis TaxID=2184697 RepID=A0A8B2P1V9_9HYPH|nr:protein-disulfide reductase DsbD domain-containing protein [Acuticoccus sediminis]RAI03112.1 thiol:disulfide interchange protein [Acuticoccus sediminis]
MLRSICLAAVTATLSLAAALGSPALADEAARVDAGHLHARFLLRNTVTAPGDTVDIAIRHQLDEGWHTYWTNPGDSGGPPVVDWDLGGGTAGPLRFPTPERIPYPPLMNYGYSGDFTLLTSLTVPADWPVGAPWPVSARVDWLVCEKICIPESANVTFKVPTGLDSEPNSAAAFAFVEAGWDLPVESDAAATFERAGDKVLLTVPGASAEDAYFFPEDRELLDHVAAQPAEATDGGVRLTLTPAGHPLGSTFSGILSTAKGATRITATGEADPVPPPAAASTAPPPNGGTGDGGDTTVATAPAQTAAAPAPAPLAAAVPGPTATAGLGLWQALGLAFLGGVILNLMPCVFPVLAVKALGLVAHADAPLRHRAVVGGAYMAGVIVSLAAVAAIMLGLRAGGAAIGWGFQLQSPAFVAAMTLVLFVFGLNLSGVFELGTTLTRFGARGGSGPAAAFSTGLLATVVATPCTAPFMAPAMGAALVASPLFAIAVFAALGVGLALPFVLLAVAPGAARILPRPGMWMVRFKQALAFPLYLTAAWLFWVLAQLVSVESLLPAMAALVLVAMAAWLFGLSQRGSGRSHRVASGLAAASLALALVALWPALSPMPSAMALGSSLKEPLGQGAVLPRHEEPFSPERLAALRAEGKPVFVNVTAAWCITCKVNEKVVLSGAAFRGELARNDVTYLKADWTRRDPEVTRFIEEFGRAGVPLYVHFPADGEPQVLPQILTLSTLRTAFES